MLSRTPEPLCVQCGLAYGAPGFLYHAGKPQNGPAYWCDRGLLCSPACAIAHFRLRIAEGSFSPQPAAEPLDISLQS